MPTKYHPLTDPQYMSKAMKAFFRAKLKSQRGDIHKRSLAFGKTLQGTTIKEPDSVDQSSLIQSRYDHWVLINKRHKCFIGFHKTPYTSRIIVVFDLSILAPLWGSFFESNQSN